MMTSSLALRWADYVVAATSFIRRAFESGFVKRRHVRYAETRSLRRRQRRRRSTDWRWRLPPPPLPPQCRGQILLDMMISRSRVVTHNPQYPTHSILTYITSGDTFCRQKYMRYPQCQCIVDTSRALLLVVRPTSSSDTRPCNFESKSRETPYNVPYWADACAICHCDFQVGIPV